MEIFFPASSISLGKSGPEALGNPSHKAGGLTDFKVKARGRVIKGHLVITFLHYRAFLVWFGRGNSRLFQWVIFRSELCGG